MKLTWSWLLDWHRPSGSPRETAERLTAAGLAVDRCEPLGPVFEGVVVARVLEAAKHPNADRLTVCTVDAGNGRTFQIVCGAPNARAGLVSALALPGATLPNGTTIRKSKLRGVESEGMLCSGVELALSEEKSGILELDPGLPPGRPLGEVLGGGDWFFDLDVPHNRGDVLSVLGIAREAAAAEGRRLEPPPPAPLEERGPRAEGLASLAVEDREGCPRYLARIVTGVRVGPSPAWLVRRLESVGQRSVNNVVDVTNWCMLSWGQPLHAFDLSRLGGPAVVVRRARPGEKLTTLDGVLRSLDPEILVIADRDRPVAIAGLMGGRESEVTDATTEILLESAYFDPRRVAIAAKRLALRTEASARFARGVDPFVVERALDEAARLLAEVAGATVCAGRLDRTEPALLAPRALALDPAHANACLGTDLSADDMAALLAPLGFETRAGGAAPPPTGRVSPSAGGASPAALRVEIPAWRSDVLEEIDLVEEVARRHGYDRIANRERNASSVRAVRSADERRIDGARSLLAGLGYQEIVTKSLEDPEALRKARVLGAPDEAELLRPLNPVSSEYSALRPSLLSSGLRAAALNLRRGSEGLLLFEIGKTFHADGSERGREDLEVLLVATLGEFPPDLSRALASFELLDLKGSVEAFLDGMGVRSFDAEPSSPAWADAAGGIRIVKDGGTVAVLAEVDAAVRDAFGVSRRLGVALLPFEALAAAPGTALTFREPSKYPQVKRDLALVVDVDVPQVELLRIIREAGGEWLREVALFDVFTGGKVPAGRKSLAYALSFQTHERTLSDEEVDRRIAGIVRAAESRLRATLRTE